MIEYSQLFFSTPLSRTSCAPVTPDPENTFKSRKRTVSENTQKAFAVLSPLTRMVSDTNNTELKS